jgi:prevent-host-death family protein
MAEQVNIQRAKTELSRIVARVEQGEEIVLARAGKPVARIVPIEQGRRREPGRLRGQGWIGDDFDDPLDEDVQAAFEGRSA